MTSNEVPSTDGRSGDLHESEPTLLGEVLAFGPRLASRTIAQIQASQQLISVLRCGGDTSAVTDIEDAPVGGLAMTEPVDVLGVLGEEAHDEVEDATAETFMAFAEGSQAPEAAELVIPGYDSLAASQVVPRLTTLSPDELSAIGSYEQAHRGRRTILNRVTQLLATTDADS